MSSPAPLLSAADTCRSQQQPSDPRSATYHQLRRPLALMAVCASTFVALTAFVLKRGGVPEVDTRVWTVTRAMHAPVLTRAAELWAELGGMRGTLTLAALLSAVLLWNRKWARLAGLATVVFGI